RKRSPRLAQTGANSRVQKPPPANGGRTGTGRVSTTSTWQPERSAATARITTRKKGTPKKETPARAISLCGLCILHFLLFRRSRGIATHATAHTRLQREVASRGLPRASPADTRHLINTAAATVASADCRTSPPRQGARDASTAASRTLRPRPAV